MRIIILALIAVPVLGVFPAGAATGPQVPLTVQNALEFSVTVGGGTGGEPTSVSVQTSGALPLSLPFNLTNSTGCNSFGTAILSNVSGGLQIDITGGSLSASIPPACRLSVRADASDAAFHVPDIGEAVTPVFWFMSRSLSTTGGVVLAEVNFFDAPDYGSAVLGNIVRQAHDSIGFQLAGSEPDGSFGPEFYIPGDDVAFVVNFDEFNLRGTWDNDTVSGTLDATIRLEAFLPPSASFAAFPAPAFSPFGRALLVAAILGGAGLTLVRRRV